MSTKPPQQHAEHCSTAQACLQYAMHRLQSRQQQVGTTAPRILTSDRAGAPGRDWPATPRCSPPPYKSCVSTHHPTPPDHRCAHNSTQTKEAQPSRPSGGITVVLTTKPCTGCASSDAMQCQTTTKHDRPTDARPTHRGRQAHAGLPARSGSVCIKWRP